MRGTRVGEASNPGPRSLTDDERSNFSDHDLYPRRPARLLSYNIGSLHRHLEEVLCVASEHHAQFIALQETGVTENQLPSLSHRLRLRGWSLSAIPPRALKGGGRGGLAILAREPLTTEVLHQAVSEEGQLLSVQVFGTKEPWVIHCGYRRPAMDDSGLLLELSASVSITRHRPWVFACDWNDDPHDSSLQATLQDIDGRVIATSQHQRSTRPTDSVWTRSDMKAVSQSLPFISDHSAPGVVRPSLIGG